MQIAYREWRIRVEPESRMPILQSTHMQTLWDGPELTADRLPENDTSLRNISRLHGIHAVVNDYPLNYGPPTFLKTMRSYGSYPWVMLMAVGALDVSGKVVEHVDGVLRAETVKILALRVDERVWIQPACGHNEYGVYSGMRTDSWVLRRLCGGRVQCRHEFDMPDEYLFGPSAQLEFLTDVFMLEQQLRERYEVPRLPADRGPWAKRGPMHTCVGGQWR